MDILSKDINDVIILFALKEKEDSDLLLFANQHIEWLIKNFWNVTIFNGSISGIGKILGELRGRNLEKPTLIEVISHGNLSSTHICCDKDQVEWKDFANAIAQFGGGKEIIVNAMSTCMSFKLIDELSGRIPNVFASNLTSSGGAFYQSKTLYTNGLQRMEFGLKISSDPKHYTWYTNGQQTNPINWIQRYDLMKIKHQDDPKWKEWNPILMKASGIV